MSRRWELFVLLGFLLIFSALSEAKDLYKILEVDKSASQRDIQKAFHKLSLKYHPDKNKDKNAQAKFAEINNAYEILSDEEKRKNYDTFGDEQGNQRFEGGGFGGGPGYGSSHFNFDGQNSQHFTFQQGGPQSGGGRQNFQHFTFPFEKSGGDGSYSFTYDFSGANFMEDIFSNLFGSTKSDQASWNPFGGYAGPQGGAKSSSQNPQLIVQLDSKSYREKVSDQRATWLLMFYTPSSKGYQELESILEQVANSLQGIVKVGIINCQSQQKLCREQNAIPQKTAKLFVYSIRSNGKGSMLEYSGDWNVKDVKNYCLDLLPRFSKRIDNNDLDDLFRTPHKLPKMLLLTTKKNTPAIWRALSGIYHNRALFYDAEVPDVSSPIAKKLGVKALPAVIGILSNGDAILLSSGSGSPQNVEEIGKFIENLERRNLKVTPTQKSSESNQGAKDSISLLTRETADMLCGSHTPLCVIGVFKSAQGREKLKAILKEISHKTFTRGRRFDEVKDPVSYSLLDAAKQKSFSRAFDKSGFKDVDTVLVAYKPRKERFALYKGPFTFENTERFISEVLNGDIQFKNVLQKPGF